MAGVSGILAFRAPLRTHPQHPVAAILAKVGHVGSAGFIHAQGIVQQQPHHGRGARRLGTGVGIGRGDQGPGLVTVQADGGGVVRIHHRPRHALGGHPADQVMGRAVPVKRRKRRQAAADTGLRRSRVELGGGPQVHMHPPGRQRTGLPLGEPAEPGHHILGVGAAGTRRPYPGQPRRHQDLLPLPQLADHWLLRPHPAQQLDRQHRRACARRARGDRPGQPFEVTCHGPDGSAGHRH